MAASPVASGIRWIGSNGTLNKIPLELKDLAKKLVPLRKSRVQRIGIIGGGFTGTMTAVQLIRNTTRPLEIFLINERGEFNKGLAYAPYTDKHLLNVTTGRMSAFPDRPDHFLDHVMALEKFRTKDRSLIAGSFLPRRIYGEYLRTVWKEAMDLAARNKVKVHLLKHRVDDLRIEDDRLRLMLNGSEDIIIDDLVIATGNQLPRDPRIRSTGFFPSERYFRDPWNIASVTDINEDHPVLIIGNGLTMVDTVLGLLEQGFKGRIYSLSPNGFNILPHRHSSFKYTRLTDELPYTYTLADLVHLVNKHVKAMRDHGITAEPVIDSLRPHTQRIWKSLTPGERSLFMSRLRHLWGVARHRIPLNTYDKIQQLRIDGTLKVISGKITDLQEQEDHVLVQYFDKKDRVIKEMKCARIINCTGPETDLMHLDNGFLKNCLLNGIFIQDDLKLGIRTNTDTFQVLDPQGRPYANLFTLGSNLRGELWESTAINELRVQAERLAAQLAVKKE